MPRCIPITKLIENIATIFRINIVATKTLDRTKQGYIGPFKAPIFYVRHISIEIMTILLVIGHVIQPAVAADLWIGPTTGPSAAINKQIVLVAADMRNEGIHGAVTGIEEAAAVLGWRVTILDGNGNDRRTADMMHEAFAKSVDGVVLLGMDAVSWAPEYTAAAAAYHIPIVGWHVGPQPGLVGGTPVAINITTGVDDVADLAAQATIDQFGGSAGVVILTDNSLAIAVSKSRRMASLIRTCERCTLLEVIDVPISDTATMMPGVVRDIIRRYDSRLTHLLAINDLYFDDAVETLQQIGGEPRSLSLISAGDGSPKAFDRIRAGLYQSATVAEPLNLQGWILADELNRLFAHEPISGFVPPPHLVVRDNIDKEGGDRNCYDPDNGYRAIYRHIWRP